MGAGFKLGSDGSCYVERLGRTKTRGQEVCRKQGLDLGDGHGDGKKGHPSSLWAPYRSAATWGTCKAPFFLFLFHSPSCASLRVNLILVSAGASSGLYPVTRKGEKGMPLSSADEEEDNNNAGSGG